MDALLSQCGRNYCNVEFIFDFDAAGDTLYGVRLRPYGRNAPKNRMALGCGYTAEEALRQAVEKAKANRWEALDWAARPWEVTKRATSDGWFE